MKWKKTLGKPSNIGVSALSLVIQAIVGIWAVYYQTKLMQEGGTPGVSVGMFTALCLSNAINLGLGLYSFLIQAQEDRIPAATKMIPYVVGGISNFWYLVQCITSRHIHGGHSFENDDVYSLIVFVGLIAPLVCLWLFFRGKKEIAVLIGIISAVAFSVAHSALAIHIYSNGTKGLHWVYIVATLIATGVRIIQNKYDMNTAGSDQEKVALLVSEIFNFVSWCIVMVVFFLSPHV